MSTARRHYSKSPARRRHGQWRIWNCACGNTSERDHCLKCGKAYWETEWTWWTKDQGRPSRTPRPNAWANGPPPALANPAGTATEFHAATLQLLQQVVNSATPEMEAAPQVGEMLRYIKGTLQQCRKDAPLEERRNRLKSVQDKLQARTKLIDKLSHKLLDLGQQLADAEAAREQAIAERKDLEKEYQQALDDARADPEDDEELEDPPLRPTAEEFMQQQMLKRMRIDPDMVRMAAGLAQRLAQDGEVPPFPDAQAGDMEVEPGNPPFGTLHGGS